MGTANTLVYARNEGIVLNEPSVISINSRTKDVLAMGREAWHMIGRTPSHIVAVRPLRKGAITDFEVTQEMIRILLKRVGVSRFNKPRVVICVPSAITPVERRAVIDATRRAGAADAQLIEQPMAAAIGAGLPINEPIANMVVDIGAVGEQTAEEIKITIGSAYPTEEEYRAEVRGRELMSGLPKTVVLTPEEVRNAIAEPVNAMVDSVIHCLGQAPPELAQDLITQGIVLVGGGCMLRGLEHRLALEADVPVRLVEQPLEAVVLGAGRVIESYDALRSMFMDARRPT